MLRAIRCSELICRQPFVKIRQSLRASSVGCTTYRMEGLFAMKHFAAVAILSLWSWSAQAQCTGSIPQTEALLVNGTTAAGSVVVSNDTANLIVTVSTT